MYKYYVCMYIRYIVPRTMYYVHRTMERDRTYRYIELHIMCKYIYIYTSTMYNVRVHITSCHLLLHAYWAMFTVEICTCCDTTQRLVSLASFVCLYGGGVSPCMRTLHPSCSDHDQFSLLAALLTRKQHRHRNRD